jgi:hypothetical protein
MSVSFQIFRLAVFENGAWTVLGLEGMAFDSVSFYGPPLSEEHMDFEDVAENS